LGRKIALVAGAFGVTVSAAVKMFSDGAEIIVPTEQLKIARRFNAGSFAK
jgi:hypothetical protein